MPHPLSAAAPRRPSLPPPRHLLPGDVAKRYIKDPELLRFIDAECYIWSTVNADLTPMINAGMVFCDRWACVCARVCACVCVCGGVRSRG